MKKVLIASVLFALAATSLHAESMHKKEQVVSRDGKESTFKAEVIDVACYIKKGASGEQHQGCAAKCISEGGELALLIQGKLYVPVDKDFHSARKQFLTHGGETVLVTGTTSGKDGVNYFILTKPIREML